jgi:hypothetical protein
LNWVAKLLRSLTELASVPNEPKAWVVKPRACSTSFSIAVMPSSPDLIVLIA